MDWYTELPHDRYTAADLTRLDELRTNHPILHLIMTYHSGRRCGSNYLAHRLGWPHDTVLRHLRAYKRDGLVIDSEGHEKAETLLWKLTVNAKVVLGEDNLDDWSHATQLSALKLFWLDQRAQVDLDVAVGGE